MRWKAAGCVVAIVAALGVVGAAGEPEPAADVPKHAAAAPDVPARAAADLDAPVHAAADLDAPEGAAAALYVHPVLRFGAILPPGWSQETHPGGLRLRRDRSALNIALVPRTTPAELEKRLEGAMKGGRKLAESQVDVDRRQGRSVTFSSARGDAAVHSRVVMLPTMTGTLVLGLDAPADAFERDNALFERVLSTFRTDAHPADAWRADADRADAQPPAATPAALPGAPSSTPALPGAQPDTPGSGPPPLPPRPDAAAPAVPPTPPAAEFRNICNKNGLRFTIRYPGNLAVTYPDQTQVRFEGAADGPLAGLLLMARYVGTEDDPDTLVQALAAYRDAIAAKQPAARFSEPADLKIGPALAGQEMTGDWVADGTAMRNRVAVVKDNLNRYYMLLAIAPRDVFDRHAAMIARMWSTMQPTAN